MSMKYRIGLCRWIAHSSLHIGTIQDPIIVKSAGEEHYVGCTGYPADSHTVIWLTVSDIYDFLLYLPSYPQDLSALCHPLWCKCSWLLYFWIVRSPKTGQLSVALSVATPSRWTTLVQRRIPTPTVSFVPGPHDTMNHTNASSNNQATTITALTNQRPSPTTSSLSIGIGKLACVPLATLPFTRSSISWHICICTKRNAEGDHALNLLPSSIWLSYFLFYLIYIFLHPHLVSLFSTHSLVLFYFVEYLL